MTATLDRALPGADDDRGARRERARTTLGVSADSSPAPKLRPVLREHGLTAYPLVALGLLAVVDTFQGYAFTVLTPEISRALGVSFGAIAAARTLGFLAIVLAPLPMAALAQSRGRRGLLCITTGIAWSVITLYTGYVTSLLALMAVLVLDGLSTGSVKALHAPLVIDSYPPQARVRALSGYQAFDTFGQLLAPLLVALLAGPLDLTWRGVFLGMGAVSIAASLASIGLRDPGPGRFDAIVERGDDASATELGFFEVLRRVLLVPTIKRLAVGYFTIGILLIPFGTYLAVFLETEWDLGPSGRGLFLAATAALSIVALVVVGPYAERVYRRDPARLLVLSGWALCAAVTCIALGALAPVFPLMFLLLATSQSLLALLAPSLTAASLSILDPRFRSHAAAVVGMFAAAGSIVGVLLLSGIDRRFGVSVALAVLMLPGLAAGLVVRSASRLINDDLDRMIDDTLEDEDVRTVLSGGGRLPLLACKGIDFSYGQLQVLYDVDFTVDDGEMVALLGTNGAGKSTLLKVVAGLGLPSRGTVRLCGTDITYLDTERRVPLGMSLISGGKATFGGMDVVENLRAYGYSLGRDRKRVDASIEECFAAFPRLHERRASLAANLSGGEQQMVALSKALILQPRLLLIDELSLGLAPVVVGQLLEMVRRINATGTAVVLVEQSVNIALSLVDHAYFMEKGEMRFDGAAQQLLERDDLLRAVFLDGATAAGEA